MTAGAGPLKGFRVIDVTRALAGPFCTMILGDLGADVIKIEPLQGDMSRKWGPFASEVSVYYVSVNRNKRSLALDMHTEEGLGIERALASDADVFVENFRPGVAAAMGLGYEALAAKNPRLIYASVSGFGGMGWYEERVGFDQIAQGMSGWMSITGTQQSGPLRVGVPVADLAAGMWSAIGVLAAAVERPLRGSGRRVDVSLLGSLLGMLTVQGQRYLTLGDVPTLTDNHHPVLAPYGTFSTANGSVNIAVATDRMWRALCHLLEVDSLVDHPSFSDNSRRVANRSELNAILQDRLQTRTKEEWTTLCLAEGIAAGPIYGIDEALSDPNILDAGCVEEIAHPILGMLKQLANPVRLGPDAGPSVRSAPPLLGQHSREILRAAGFTEANIRDLTDRGAVSDASVSAT